MINTNFVIFGALLVLIGSYSYLVDTLKGKVKPNKVSWFLWAVVPIIAFIAEIKQGVGLQSLMTFTVGFIPFVIFSASFVNKKSYWKITFFDLLCGVFSVFGLILWYLTKSANIAILFSIFADLLAGVPTFIKSFLYPETENYHVFLLGAVSAAITLLTINIWNVAQYGYPLYIFITDLIFFVLIKFKPSNYFLAKR